MMVASDSQVDAASEAERLTRLSKLVGGFAHEIKNPLSTIGLNLGLMEEELREPLSAREKRILTRTQRLSKEVERLQGILDDFLNFVRSPVPVRQNVALNRIVREVTDLAAPEIEKKGISLRLLLSPTNPDAFVDPRLVHQLLLNLLRNAEQALEDAGRAGEIIIGTSFDESGERPWHVLSVTDSGPGMPDEVREQCFQPYFSTKRGGTGLGLAITRRFVEDHHGEIGIESEAGVGTRITVRFPHDAAEAEAEGS